MRTKASFLRYTGYLNFINGPISRVYNYSACTTTELSIVLTSCLTAIKNHVIKYCTTVYERNGTNLFWSIKKSGEILNKLKSRVFLASCMSTYDFSTLYTTLPHNLIKEKLTELIEQTFNREGSLYLACNDKNAFFFTSERPTRYKLWSCQKMCDALNYLLDNIFIRFGLIFYRQIVGIPMGTNCAPLVADLFLFCYERDFMLSLSDNNQTDIIEAFISTSRYLDDLLNIDNPYFEQMVGQIYPSGLQLNKASSSDTEALFLDLALAAGSVVVDFLFIVTPIVGVCNCSMFCFTLLYVNSSIAIILMWKRELAALLNLSSWCLMMVERLFLVVPWGCLLFFLILVFPDHTHLLFLNLSLTNGIVSSKIYDKWDDFNFEIVNFPFLD